MYEKAVDALKEQCRQCRIGQALNLLMDSVAKVEAAEPIKPKPSGSKPVKAAATKPDRNRIEKPCNKCHTVKPLREYPLNKECLDGHEGTCIICKRDRASAYWRKRYGKREATGPVPDPDLKHPCLHPGCKSSFRSRDTLGEHMKLGHSS